MCQRGGCHGRAIISRIEDTQHGDSKIGEIYEGANEVQRLVIARAIFGKEYIG